RRWPCTRAATPVRTLAAMSLTTRVLLGLLAGLAAGLAISMSGSPGLLAGAQWIEPVGTLFINAVRMTVIPLVVGSLVAGIASSAEPRALGRLGLGAVVLCTGTLGIGAQVPAVVVPPWYGFLANDPGASEAVRTAAAGTGASASE